ncbi:MAG: hypothetical protein EA382_11735 [Spirochaetaceae bacterium]|nr:MAG: hypothetical protein EA382_11735 [Spirochaetaceae bacterium]
MKNAAPLAADLTPGPTVAHPLLVGDWPDPTVCRGPDAYYMTHGCGPYQPSALIWRSPDLFEWTPIAHAVSNQIGMAWVGDIDFYQGRFYLYCSVARQHCVVHAEDPTGPWSEPIPLLAPLFDIGHIADETGARYLFNAGGKRIRLTDNGLAVAGELEKVHDAWPIPADWSIECECLEAPRLVKRGEWYHMIAAEGGTFGPATAHMAVVARARSLDGPWENAPHNPFIHTYSRSEAWWTKGHGNLIEGPDGRWWCIFHGHRAHHTSLSRCTLIEPVEWTADEWPYVPPEWPQDAPAARVNLELSDDFTAPTLGLQWQFHEDASTDRYELAGESLTLTARGAEAHSSQPLCLKPRDESYVIEAELEVLGSATGGMMLFAAPDFSCGLELTGAGTIRRVWNGMRQYRWAHEVPYPSRRITFRFINRHEDVAFQYRDEGGSWRTLQPGQDVGRLGDTTNGSRVALFAHGEGAVRFLRFEYRGLEP